MARDLKSILSIIPYLENNNQYSSLIINAIRIDSRQVTSGDMFIAYPGSSADGRKYIANALANGASVILYESNNFSLDENLLSSYKKVIAIPVKSVSQYISGLAGQFYNNPSIAQDVYAVTGTNGKTTCAYLLSQLLHYLNKKVGFIGTIGYGEIAGFLYENNITKLINTTPNPILLQFLLSEFNKKEINNIVMEASSHALDQCRVSGIEIETAIFTNLTHDHLDYHHTIEDYYLAKRKLFFYSSVQNIVINIDDAYGVRLFKELLSDKQYIDKKNIVIYSMKNHDLAAYTPEKNNIKLLSYNNKNIYINNRSYDFEFNLIGKFNVYNALAVIGALLTKDYDITELLKYTSKLKAAPGRMEVFISKSKNIKLIVDYAHTPDALQKTLLALQEQYINHKIWCIFGCGGDRDPLKRPEMGSIATKYADKIIITDDNPRTELSENIIEDIKKGIRAEDYRKLFAIINNRREAIKAAMDNADNNDVILIAGKGHEDYQIYGTEYLKYNEREFVAELVKYD